MDLVVSHGPVREREESNTDLKPACSLRRSSTTATAGRSVTTVATTATTAPTSRFEYVVGGPHSPGMYWILGARVSFRGLG